MKKVTALLLALMLCLSLFACSGNETPTTTGTPSASSPTGTQASPDKVVESITYGLRNNSWDLSPWKSTGSSGSTIWPQLYSCLLANPAFGTPLTDMQYDMAESIEFSADKMTATVRLRDYIHDSQGNPIKAQDIVFSYQTAPNVSGTYAKIDSLLESITAKDEYTVEMKIKKIFPGTWETLLSYCPIVSQEWYEGASAEDRAGNPASTGAYRVKENVVGTSVILEALDDFWQKDELRTIYQIANVKTINYVCLVEESIRAIALENGEIDVAYLEGDSFARFGNNPEYNTFEVLMPNPGTWLLNCSEGRPFHDNVALRKAVLHAVDFEQIAIASAGEWAFQGHDVAPSNCDDFNPAWNDQPYYEYNLDLAQQYLAEAGYNDKSGLELHFLCRNIGTQKAAITVAQSCLEKIGINLIIDDYDQALYDTYIVDPTQWDMVVTAPSMTSGFIVESWDYFFGSHGDQGTVGFVKDAKLQLLLDDVIAKNDADSKEAFRDYYMDQAYGVSATSIISLQFAHSYITDVPISFLGSVVLNACTFSSDYTG